MRLMRDIGYNFRWADLYCENLFSRGFEAETPLVGPYEAVTAFEVFEHLLDPIAEMKKLSSISSCLIFSTRLVPTPLPQPTDWWYYGLEHGQHVALYSRRSLEVLGEKFGFQFFTNGQDIHVFSRKPIAPDFFTVPPHRPRWQFWAKRPNRILRASLTMSDHDFIVKQLTGKF